MFAVCCAAEEGGNQITTGGLPLASVAKLPDATPVSAEPEAEPGAEEGAAPPAVADSFTVVFDCSGEGMQLGLLLDTVDGKSCIIQEITEGLVQNHNMKSSLDQVIKLHDNICSVNGSGSDKAELLKALEAVKRGAALTMCFERPKEQTVLINKPGQIGIELCYQQTSYGLTIKNIQSGLLDDWNRANPSTPIRTGARIVAMNGVTSGPMGLLKSMKESDILLLTVMNYQ
ncbi:unnamed protein product [Polarella glacialis]|uniref:PDZ domain-containing protein n=1 Tax=Polarella glacialis TaxID=89957 RepID=A0A813L4S5_POLGL|nr:unnamed protein product [Polarella glacialis]CAE8715337.1 unnamed protein product [Polarella glacialis]